MRLVFSLIGLMGFMAVQGYAAQPVIKVIGRAPSENIARPLVDCRNALGELHALQQRQNNNHNDATAWASMVASSLRQWHNTLSPYEGQTITVRDGGFDFIDNSANAAVNQTKAFSNTADQIRRDYNEIINVLTGCIKQE